jgi:hypothetical protein
LWNSKTENFGLPPKWVNFLENPKKELNFLNEIWPEFDENLGIDHYWRRRWGALWRWCEKLRTKMEKVRAIKKVHN